jgi:hypothetical protein
MQIRLYNIVFLSTLLLGGSSFCAAIEAKSGKATKEGNKAAALDTRNEFGANVSLRTRRKLAKPTSLDWRNDNNEKFEKKMNRDGLVRGVGFIRLKIEDIMQEVRKLYIYIYIVLLLYYYECDIFVYSMASTLFDSLTIILNCCSFSPHRMYQN